MRSAGIAIVALAFVAFAKATTIQSDITALQGLATCIQANAANLPGIQGWGASTASSAALNAISSFPIPTPGVESSSQSASDPCGTTLPWTGILCTATSSGNTVTTLTLSQLGPNSLTGCDLSTLTDLSGLANLGNLTFQGTGVSGSLPASWSDGFGSLVSLSLGGNSGVTGTLPDSWSSGFPALQVLDITDCNIVGALPVSWGTSPAFPSLLSLTLGNNPALGGQLPAWTGFPKLLTLQVSSNSLTGALPSGLSLASLTLLQLSDNQLVGCLPSDWPTTLPVLQNLQLDGNALSGAVPDSWSSWSSLTSLTLFPGNNFCGMLSAALAQTPDKQGVRLQPLSGTENSDGSYSLAACTDTSCSTAYAPSPYYAPVEAPSATAAVSTQSIGSRRLLH